MKKKTYVIYKVNVGISKYHQNLTIAVYTNNINHGVDGHELRSIIAQRSYSWFIEGHTANIGNVLYGHDQFTYQIV